MRKVLVIGLGEVGEPLFRLINNSGHFKVYGYDIKKSLNLPKPPIDYLHITIPYSENFEKIVINYIITYKPRLTIIHSTVPPKTTKKIFQTFSKNLLLIVHSPIRGIHNNMDNDLIRYIKFVGPTSPRAAIEAKRHLEKIGFKTKVMGSAEETELGKLFETSVMVGMMAIWQEMERICRAMNVDYINATDFVRDTDDVRQDRPMFYPESIGGHCYIPNIELLLKASNECRPKPFTIVFLNAWRSNFLTQANPPSEEVVERMKELFKRSRLSRS